MLETASPVFRYALSISVTVTELLIASMLFAHAQPQKRNPVVFVVATFLMTLVVATLLLLLALRNADAKNLAELSQQTFPITMGTQETLLLFALILIALLPMLKVEFDLNWWAAAYCATAGYALQNLGSGLGELAALLIAPQVVFSPMLVTVMACAAVYAIAWFATIRRIDPAGPQKDTSPAILLMIAAVVVAIIWFDLVLKKMTYFHYDINTLVELRIFHALVCVFVITVEVEIVVNQGLRAEKAAVEQALSERQSQYELSRANIEAINIKCHDLRHQIRHLADGGSAVSQEALDDAAREIAVYDSTVRTGNEALDTILTEKRLLCGREDITLTCIADGSALGGMAPADIYAFFGNALDNAIEAVRKLPNPDERTISVIVKRRAGMAMVHVENSCVEGISFVDGLPQTTKADRSNHGLGTRSMRAIAQRYGGTITFTAEGKTFAMDALLPARRS